MVKIDHVPGMAAGPRHGDTIQGDPARKYRRRTFGEVTGMYTPKSVRESLPHQRVRPRARPVLSQLYQ